MKEDKVITGYSDCSDEGILTESKAIIKGCTGNASYTFAPTQLTDLATKQSVYDADLVTAQNGGKLEVAKKDISKGELANSLHSITTTVNLQQKGHRDALLSSGAQLTADSNPQPSGEFAAPTTLSADAGTGVDQIAARVGTVTGQHDHGTMFAWTPALNASEDVTTWKMQYSTSHHTVIGGLTANTQYLVKAAYQNKNGIKLIWSKAVILWTKIR